MLIIERFSPLFEDRWIELEDIKQTVSQLGAERLAAFIYGPTTTYSLAYGA